jgi:hypothetical protein
MFELTIFKYTHYEKFPSNEYKKKIQENIKNILNDSFSYSFELPTYSLQNLIRQENHNRKLILMDKTNLENGLAIPNDSLRLLQELGLETKKYLFFLEREKIFESDEFIKEKIEIDKEKNKEEIIKKINKFSKTTLELNKKRNKLLIKTIYDEKLKQYFDYFKKNNIEIPETIKHTEFRGLAHNFEEAIYPLFKDNDEFSLKIFIPETQDPWDIIKTQKIFSEPKLFTSIFYYNRLTNSKKNKIKEQTFEDFEQNIRSIQKIQGKKIEFEEYYEIIRKINKRSLLKLNKILEQEFRETNWLSFL